MAAGIDHTKPAKCSCGKYFKYQPYWPKERQELCSKCYWAFNQQETERLLALKADKELDEFLETL
jgi:hypothetical protein